MKTNRVLPRALLLLSAGVLAGCDKPQAVGDVNAVIVAMPTEAWTSIGADVEAALDERAFSVRDERVFRVTHVEPAGPDWDNLRRFRQLLLIGRPSDPWMETALDRVRGSLPPLPAVVEARDPFALNQNATLVVLPEGSDFSAARPLLPDVGARLLERFHLYSRQRMYASGADSVLADSLRSAHGFSVLLPEVYYGRQLEPNVFVFRNDHPDPSQLIRSVLISWREGTADVAAADLRGWRDQLAQRFYDPAQITADEIQSRPLENGLQVQGIWSNPPDEWPAAGPFIARAVRCAQQNRTYLIDTWLYAPGREKYEYLLQLNTILGTFACDGTVR
jgi:hypothetical protein